MNENPPCKPVAMPKPSGIYIYVDCTRPSAEHRVALKWVPHMSKPPGNYEWESILPAILEDSRARLSFSYLLLGAGVFLRVRRGLGLGLG